MIGNYHDFVLFTDQWKVVSPLTKPVLGGSFVKINDLPTIVGGSAQSGKNQQRFLSSFLNEITPFNSIVRYF